MINDDVSDRKWKVNHLNIRDLDLTMSPSSPEKNESLYGIIGEYMYYRVFCALARMEDIWVFRLRILVLISRRRRSSY